MGKPELVAIDHSQQLIANIVNVDQNEYDRFYEVSNQRVVRKSVNYKQSSRRIRNKHSGIEPCVLHIPGLHVAKQHPRMKAYREIEKVVLPKKVYKSADEPVEF